MDRPLRHAAHDFVLVFVAALAFFGFVIGSGLTGWLGQSIFGLIFGCAVLAYGWRRLDPGNRDRLVLQSRRLTRRAPSER